MLEAFLTIVAIILGAGSGFITLATIAKRSKWDAEFPWTPFEPNVWNAKIWGFLSGAFIGGSIAANLPVLEIGFPIPATLVAQILGALLAGPASAIAIGTVVGGFKALIYAGGSFFAICESTSNYLAGTSKQLPQSEAKPMVPPTPPALPAARGRVIAVWLSATDCDDAIAKAKTIAGLNVDVEFGAIQHNDGSFQVSGTTETPIDHPDLLSVHPKNLRKIRE